MQDTVGLLHTNSVRLSGLSGPHWGTYPLHVESKNSLNWTMGSGVVLNKDSVAITSVIQHYVDIIRTDLAVGDVAASILLSWPGVRGVRGAMSAMKWGYQITQLH